MGLGPPICTKCMKIMNLYHDVPGKTWECSRCGINNRHEDCDSLYNFSKEQVTTMWAAMLELNKTKK